MQSVIDIFRSGGLVMFPLAICSIAIWWVIFERLLAYRRITQDLKDFHSEAINRLLRRDSQPLRTLCQQNPELPTSRILSFAMERLSSNDPRVRDHWRGAVDRMRLMENQQLRRYLWILGTIASAAPFIGLFGTVLGILESFGDIARTGKGGFAIVAGGISEALIATAGGILVAVIAVMAYNAFQTRWGSLALQIKVHTEDFMELVEGVFNVERAPAGGEHTDGDGN